LKATKGGFFLRIHEGTLEASDNKLLKLAPAAFKVRLGRTRSHEQNFIDALKRGVHPFADAEVGHRSCTACLVNMMAMRLGRPLTWDPAMERFVNDDEANGLMTPRCARHGLSRDLTRCRMLEGYDSFTRDRGKRARATCERVRLCQIFVSLPRSAPCCSAAGTPCCRCWNVKWLTAQVVPFEEMADYYAMSSWCPRGGGEYGDADRPSSSRILGNRRGDAGRRGGTFFVILAYAVAFDQMRESSLLADAMAGLRPAVAGLMLALLHHVHAQP
jgi:hypothetical protein